MPTNKRDVATVCREYNVTDKELDTVKTVFDEYLCMLKNGEAINLKDFESKISAVMPNITGIIVTFFTENIAKAFFDEGKWADLFWELYGEIPKYKVLRRQLESKKNLRRSDA